MYTHADKEQIDQLKRVWKSWGKWLVIAMLAGGIIGFAYRQWHSYKTKQDTRASTLFQTYVDATGQDKNKILAQLQKDFSSTPYPALASLLAAKQFSANADWKKAAANLYWPMRHSSIDALKQIARMRLAEVFYQQKQYKMALKTLGTLSDTSYIAVVNQLRGDVYLAQGDTKHAKSAFSAARSWLQTNQLPTPILNRQLANIPSQGKK